ncbi:hypothetical protein AB0M20_40420 [Actinoplanes sp. NPDC051633]
MPTLTKPRPPQRVPAMPHPEPTRVSSPKDRKQGREGWKHEREGE